MRRDPDEDVIFNPLSLYRERHLDGMTQQEVGDFNPLSLYRERR